MSQALFRLLQFQREAGFVIGQEDSGHSTGGRTEEIMTVRLKSMKCTGGEPWSCLTNVAWGIGKCF
jgi:hypothetical protein